MDSSFLQPIFSLRGNILLNNTMVLLNILCVSDNLPKGWDILFSFTPPHT